MAVMFCGWRSSKGRYGSCVGGRQVELCDHLVTSTQATSELFFNLLLLSLVLRQLIK